MSTIEIDDELENISDNVNHPKHYTSHPSGCECIDITEHYDFCIGNAIKYLWRSGLKQEEGMLPKEKEKKWVFGPSITTGYDFALKEFNVYLGVSLTYNLISF